MSDIETVEEALRGAGMFAVSVQAWPNGSAFLKQVKRIEAACKRREADYKREMDEAAEHINDYLQEIPTMARPHNWLIRNGYKDTSYQASVYGQEIYEEDKNANHD